MVNDAAVDTTGAGDLWASGFLFGLVNGYSLEQCGNLGSACGFEVCQVVGANIPEQGWQRIKEYWRNYGEKKGVPIPEKRPGKT
jgi:sugar/nucleoside kinase (ribokinase family)